MKSVLFLFLGYVLFALAALVHASENDLAEPKNYTIFGYVSQSLVQSNGINLGGSFDNKWSLDKREISLSGDYRFDQGLSVRVAVGTIDEPYMREKDVYVKYALIDKRWQLNKRHIVGTRIGRVPHSFGFYNALRNAPASNYHVYFPEGLPGYHESFKYVAMSGDGGQLYWYNQINPYSNIEITGTYTKATLVGNNRVVDAYLSNEKIGTFDNNNSYVGSFAIEGRYKNLNMYYNYVNMNFMFKFNEPWAIFIPNGKVKTHLHVVGAKVFIDDFEIGAEWSKVILTGDTWRNLVTTDNGSPVGWILNGTWHVSGNLDLSVYRSEYYTQEGDKDGIKQATVAATSGEVYHPHWHYTKSNSITIKYKVSDSVTLKGQYTKGKGIAAFNKIENLHGAENWKYTALQMVYTF